MREVNEFVLHALNCLNRLLVGESVDRSQVEEFPVSCLSYFVYLEVVTLENSLSFELSVEKSHASVLYRH